MLPWALEWDGDSHTPNLTSFFRPMAYNCAARRFKRLDRGGKEHQKEVDVVHGELLDLEAAKQGHLNPHCPCCSCTTMAVYGPHDGGERALHPFNISVDRLDHEDTLYRLGRFRFVCQVCNFVRGKATIKVGDDRLGRMAASWAEGGTVYDGQWKVSTREVVDAEEVQEAGGSTIRREVVDAEEVQEAGGSTIRRLTFSAPLTSSAPSAQPPQHHEAPLPHHQPPARHHRFGGKAIVTVGSGQLSVTLGTYQPLNHPRVNHEGVWWVDEKGVRHED